MSIKVTKRNGSLEDLNYDKIHKILDFACRGLHNISVSEIALKSKIQFFNKIKSSDIHDVLIKTAAEMISEQEPDYQYVAARLLNYKLRKIAFGQFEPWDLLTVVKRGIDLKLYDSLILTKYSEEEINTYNKLINHEYDENFTYVGVKQFESKFLIKNRKEKKCIESIQQAYMLVAMTLHMNEKVNRTKKIKDYYLQSCKGQKSVIVIPTPLLGGLRTPTRQYASCCVIKSGDSIESINAAASAITTYASKRAGIGIDSSLIRSLGSSVRNGEVTHTGIIPYLKLFESAVCSSSQGGLRKGSATNFLPIFHKEIFDLLVLKNNKGTPDNRVNRMDHSFQLDGYFLRQAIGNKPYYLFNGSDFPELYESFFAKDRDIFERLYNQEIAKDKKLHIDKRKMIEVNALEILNNLVSERVATGRVYIMFVDNMNIQSSFNLPIYSSNLCKEIGLTTASLTKFSNFTLQDCLNVNMDIPSDSLEFRDKFGEIALCILGAVNFAVITKPEELKEPVYAIVRALDNLIDFQEYYSISAEIPAKKRRNLGVGIAGLATFFAKAELKYGQNLEILDVFMEHMYYYAIEASVELAKERGACEWYKDTIYGDGKFVWEFRKNDVDAICKFATRLDWESLRNDMNTYGIRNSTLLTCMPSQTASLMLNTSQGVDPIRDVLTNTGDKENVIYMLLNPKLKYECCWDITNENYLRTMAVIQKWVDQSISSNTFLDSTKGITKTDIIKDIINAYRFGIKSLYYSNTKTHINEDECDSCKI